MSKILKIFLTISLIALGISVSIFSSWYFDSRITHAFYTKLGQSNQQILDLTNFDELNWDELSSSADDKNESDLTFLRKKKVVHKIKVRSSRLNLQESKIDWPVKKSDAVFVFISQGQSPTLELAQANVFKAISEHSLGKNVPLGGSYSEGVKILKNGDAKVEAEKVYRESGIVFLTVQQTIMPPGVGIPEDAIMLYKNKSVRFVQIPETHDVMYDKDYFNKTRNFAEDFNCRMLKLAKLPGSEKYCEESKGNNNAQ